jgi:aminoglycoside phosphotransferase (APT) family kinase protein
VRSAKVERRLTRYDGLVDFAVVMEKEIAVARLLGEAGIPTPATLAWHRTTDPEREPSWMIAEYVSHDAIERLSGKCQAELGLLARRIHAIEPGGSVVPGLAPDKPWPDWIRQRIVTRLVAARRYMAIPAAAEVKRMLGIALDARPHHPRSLLHLDLRAPNLAIRANNIAGVLDLANAIIGDPYLELARIRGCGLLTPEFLEGYGEDSTLLERYGRVLDAYELDLTALLVVVSREEVDDDCLHREMVQRTTTLLERLA